MHKSAIPALLLSVLLSLTTQANQEGIWLTATQPDYLFVVVEGDVTSEETASMFVLAPDSREWDWYFGPDTFNLSDLFNTVELAPLVSSSDMRATWRASDTDAILTVNSCTSNCLWDAGEEVSFTKAYGEGVNLDDVQAPPTTFTTCCLFGVCTQLSPANCQQSTGTFIGDVSCTPNPCKF